MKYNIGANIYTQIFYFYKLKSRIIYMDVRPQNVISISERN